jgi:uncharacterized membrane protein
MAQDGLTVFGLHDTQSFAEGEQHRAMLLSRIIDALLLVATAGTVLSVLWGGSRGKTAGTATAVFILTSTGWILLGLIYSAIRIRRIRRARKGDPRWPGWLAGRRANYLVTLGTATIVLGAGGNVAVAKGDDANSLLIRFFGITMVLVAWTILQLSYAERYARLCLDDTDNVTHLDFPATQRPSLLEFAYFSFTVGTTFGTSDVTVQSSRLRGIVMCHGLLAFVYNTAVLGLVISLISS